MNAPSTPPADPAPVAAPPAESACPPPLAWQEVLREFHRQADTWCLDRPNGRILGRTIGSGPSLYFLNGFSGTHELYALLVWLLRDEYRCVLCDYTVPRFPRRATLDDLAGDLLAVADACGDRAFSLFASSFGGLVAFEAMRREPKRIDRAIVQGGFAHRTLSRSERLLTAALRFLPGTLRRLPLREFMQLQNHRRWFPPFDTTRWQFFLDNTGKIRLGELAQRAAIVRDSDLRPALPQIEQPLLLVRSEGDGQILEACHRILAERLPGAVVESLNDTGQIPFLTHPHRLAKLIRAFLAGRPG